MTRQGHGDRQQEGEMGGDNKMREKRRGEAVDRCAGRLMGPRVRFRAGRWGLELCVRSVLGLLVRVEAKFSR